ncbi:MAG: GNAT family N-acetyltransferase, partial [Alphaproteobacteria bacterium]|nr:GNAT family N-acetyltransferase [Alphaproteobacteria bacterium]
LGEIMDLRVRDDQKDLVAPNAITIAQSHYEPFTWVRGLWAGDTAVGLIAMVDLHPDHPDLTADDPKNAAYLWRLMIDKAHQGKGYGREAMQIAFRQARAWGRDTFCVDVADREDSALGFYRRFGLEPTDRVVHGERMLIGRVPRP